MTELTVVVICGWLMAKHRPLEKYVELYAAMGYRTFVLHSNPWHLFLPQSTVQKKAFLEFQAWVESETRTNDAVVILPHILSNGGCWSWYCLENHIVQAGVPFKVPTMILDSAPSKPYAHGTAPAAFTAQMKNPILRQAMMWILTAVFVLHAFVVRVCGYTHPVELQFERLIHRDAAIPKLFLYSDNDVMIPPDQIEYAITTAKQLNTPAEAVNFETSKHVAHLSHSPDRYTKAVREFLAKYGRSTPNALAVTPATTSSVF
ncbi:hypothetical protein H310_11462 [Aphanomyces invadans]|uniref:Uncharacterized protein n=1 Tax=Aphanomyces invadans TaxID=157072 RepID=A0A024TM21_9STRA|nr:hypothetical protein H310_11462 [Aphanomyces invadans]ETV95205.1 hypothetical protein H310_11462 [Aphanomyces invadans]|eukprot:XP_008876378.1 hypothetical protein H310_11462 [Aphanomyces invadans]